MYSTTFDYFISSDDSILIYAQCKDVENWATDLKLELPRDFHPTREVADEIEQIAVSKLLDEKILRVKRELEEIKNEQTN